MSVGYRRRSIRLPEYDYAQAGYYFVTIATYNRTHLFGEIVDGEMVPNVAGNMIEQTWWEIERDFPNVTLGEYVLMPNHTHSIIQITHSVHTLSRMIQSFKRYSTLQYIQMVKNGTLPPFDKRIWQRNFYEHVIRNDADHDRIAEYIISNPLTWSEDMFATQQSNPTLP
jgi:REP element-mobilizing transposase RayT